MHAGTRAHAPVLMNVLESGSGHYLRGVQEGPPPRSVACDSKLVPLRRTQIPWIRYACLCGLSGGTASVSAPSRRQWVTQCSLLQNVHVPSACWELCGVLGCMGAGRLLVSTGAQACLVLAQQACSWRRPNLMALGAGKRHSQHPSETPIRAYRRG